LKKKNIGGGEGEYWRGRGRINERDTFEKKKYWRGRGRIKEREGENKREGEGE
jgi:hypothetical protein